MEYVFGALQEAGAAVSSLHVKLLPLSVAVNEKLGELSLLGSPGFWLTVSAGSVASIVHVWELETPAFPAWSVARTVNVWEPSPSAEYVFGDEQAANCSLSKRQRKELVSLAENTKLGALLLLRSAGFCVIVVVGAVVSIVHVWLAGGPVLPAGSVALTLNVCWPCASVPRLFGESQEANAPASSLQAKLLPLSPAEKEKLGAVLLLGSFGFTVISAAGDAVSIVQT